MHPSCFLSLLRVLVPLALAFIPASPLLAQAQSALTGKTLTLTITQGMAPFATSGTQAVKLDSPQAGQYSVDTNGTRTSLGRYTYAATNIGADLVLDGYFGDGTTATLSLYDFIAATGAGRFETFRTGVAASNSGTYTIGDGSGGGGAAAAPAITGSTSLTATVGVPFSHQIATTPAATSFLNMGGNAPIAINTLTGLVSGTFATAGTYTFSVKASNAAGSSATTTFTVTVGAATVVAAPDIGALAGAYVGQQYFAMGNGAATALFGDLVVTVTPGGVLSALGGTLTGRVDAQGNVTFDLGGATLAFGYTTGTIANGRLTAIGQVSANGVVLATYRIDAPRTGTGTGDNVTATVAPSNLVGYRNRVGQSFQFRVTGATSGAVWGTDVYTDDSSIARAAVHAGVVGVGETKVLTVSILPGRTSYPASSRHGVTSASWGGWHGSYAFAGSGVASGVTATTKPALTMSGDLPVSTLSAGGRLLLPITVTGGGPYTYQWYLNGLAIAGAIANPYVVESVGAAHAGAYTVDVTNALGTSRLSAGSVSITSVGAPVIALQPISRTVLPGGTFTLATNASGAGNAYQWYRNGVALAGETGAILLRQNVTPADAGDYTVRISNSAGSVTSNGGTVTLSGNASRPANLSVRAHVAAGQSIIPGFFLQGVGSKRVIVRAVGSALIPYGVTGTMADPKLEVYRGSTKVAESDNWDGSAATTAVFNSVGAFPLAAGSKDAALVTNLTAGEGYTVVVSGVANSSGVVLIEVYDADTAGTSTSTITNASVRGQAGSGGSTLILGFVIAGEGSRTLLVRGVGPKLASYGVAGALADPRLQIYDASDRAVLANDNWGQADFVGELVQATDFLGTFRLDAGSKDAATLALLQPGAYTVHVSGASGATGEALVEIYDVP